MTRFFKGTIKLKDEIFLYYFLFLGSIFSKKEREKKGPELKFDRCLATILFGNPSKPVNTVF